MHHLTPLACLTISMLCISSVHGAGEETMDQKAYESITGFKGSFSKEENVFKASFPREDLKVFVDSIPLDPFMGVTSWSSYTPLGENTFMVMGDLALFQDEVNPVMSTLLNNNLHVTALHNHFFYDNPRVFFMHIGGTGSLKDLSSGVKQALDMVREIRSKHPTPPLGFEGPSISKENNIAISGLETIFSVPGLSKDGMAKFVFGRSVTMDAITVHKDMGINTWAAFAGTEEQCVVDGDFAVFENELQPVLKTLRNGGIYVVAIHQHMTMESPRLLFLHYWGKGKAKDLAKTIKEALQYTR